jgi:hypothetical protein
VFLHFCTENMFNQYVLTPVWLAKGTTQWCYLLWRR